MKRAQKIRIALALFLGVTGVLDAASPGQDLKSDWVEVSSGGLFGHVGEKPQVMLTLRSKAAQPAWVKVRVVAPSPNVECSLVEAMKPDDKVTYTCVQEKIVPDAEYPIFVTTYRDEALTDEAETRQTAMRFSKRDAKALEEYLTAPEVPATFKDMNYTEKLTAGSAFAGRFGMAQGILVVEENVLRYSLKDKVTEIPVSQIRGVEIRGDWVAVQYAEGDAVRTVGFQGSPFRGAGFRVAELEKAISYVWSKQPKDSQP